MADGILGGYTAAANTKHTLYTVDTGVKAVFRIHCSNPTSSEAEITIYLDDGSNEYISTIAPIAPDSTLVIPNLVLSAGQIIKVESDTTSVVFVANGIEDLI